METSRKIAASKRSSRRKAKSTKRTSSYKRPATIAPAGKRWSQDVTDTSDALDLKQGVFKIKNPKNIAASLKRSAERSERRKANPYRSALSMLTFYVNRAGRNLPQSQLARLERAKGELKKQFGRV